MTATFVFQFVEMGQGDCCMVQCPDGEVVMVDCGRTKNPYGSEDAYSTARTELRSPDWAGAKGNTVAALILTHPDADHHNLVVNMFATLPKIEITRILISNATTGLDRGPMGKYRAAALSANVYNGLFGEPTVEEVTINNATADAGNRVRVWNAKDHYKAYEEKPVSDRRYKVMGGKTDGDSWAVEIIAGNVPKGYGKVKDGATPDNAATLVILFSVGDRKALLCGDATLSTEAFLLAAHADLIKDVDLVQIPHHGSVHASGPAFVEKLNPRSAVVSVGFLETGYFLPRDAVHKRWKARVMASGGGMPEHEIDAWRFGTGKSVDKLFREWETTPPTGGVEQNDKGNVRWLLEPQHLTLPAIWGGFLGTDGRRGMRYERTRTSAHLTSTGEGTQFYELTKDGIESVRYDFTVDDPMDVDED